MLDCLVTKVLGTSKKEKYTQCNVLLRLPTLDLAVKIKVKLIQYKK